MPGLTRENVASHLQKYRLYLKRLQGVQGGAGGNGGAGFMVGAQTWMKFSPQYTTLVYRVNHHHDVGKWRALIPCLPASIIPRHGISACHTVPRLQPHVSSQIPS